MFSSAFRSLAIKAFILSSVISGAAHAEGLSLPILTVQGRATLSKPADELRINIGAVTQEKTAEKALDSNNDKMEKIINALKQNGLEKGEYATGRFTIRPVYGERPKNPPPGWTPEIVGYEVTSSLSVKTGKIDKAGILIDQAARAGANSIDNISFGLKDPNKYRTEAIDAATKNALQDAKTLGLAAGVSLVSIQSINLDEASPAPMPRHGPFYMKAMGAESVPIEPGEIEITSSVTIQYQIR